MKYTYKDSGVDLESSKILATALFSGLSSTNFENFAGTIKLPLMPGYRLVAAADGIGTKIIPLFERKMFAEMAQDLAAMNLNDLICTGAKPLCFLDYIATNKLEPDTVKRFIFELNSLLKRYNCALLGGETSELGGFIASDAFDAAGFAVGLVEEEYLINKNNVCENDVVIGLKSSGVHSNGFSLIRKLYKDGCLNEEEFTKTLAPTVIYVDEILKTVSEKLVSGLANITGGGILANVERAVPDGLCAVLDKKAIPDMEIFKILGKFSEKDEMYRTFNMGAGFCIIAKEKNLDKILKITKKHAPFVFGRIEKSKNGPRARFAD